MAIKHRKACFCCLGNHGLYGSSAEKCALLLARQEKHTTKFRKNLQMSAETDISDSEIVERQEGS